jgi:hypothetical protein
MSWRPPNVSARLWYTLEPTAQQHSGHYIIDHMKISCPATAGPAELDLPELEVTDGLHAAEPEFGDTLGLPADVVLRFGAVRMGGQAAPVAGQSIGWPT